MIDDASLPLGGACQQHLLDDRGKGVGVALDRAGEGITAERVRKRTFLIIGRSPSRSGMRSSSTMMNAPSRSTTGRSAAK